MAANTKKRRKPGPLWQPDTHSSYQLPAFRLLHERDTPLRNEAKNKPEEAAIPQTNNAAQLPIVAN
jgi:hypothetical protein